MADMIDAAVSERLRAIQHDLFDRGIPVLLLIEGCGGKAMGKMISEIIDVLEPRGVEYHHFIPDEKWKGVRDRLMYFEKSPGKGRFTIFDRGWYSRLIEHSIRFPSSLDDNISAAIELERYMVNNGTRLIKIFLNSDDGLNDALDVNSDDCGDLSDDAVFTAEYDANDGLAAQVIARTSKYAEWDVINVTDMRDSVNRIADVLAKRLPVESMKIPVPAVTMYTDPRDSADLSRKLDGGYDEKMKTLTKDIGELQCRLVKTDMSLIVLFEGWDAAGKGGCIRRLSHALNPRGYRTVPIGVPDYAEMRHPYLWRFCDDLPGNGRITIFDRSWYGRMMVEPIERLINTEEYNRAASEINDFEKELVRSNTTIIKFWMEISKDEQLKRFDERKEDPKKQWKLTDDDWRNRSKWDEYERYVDEMIKSTNTPYAPWTVVESEDKKYGRVKVLRTVRDTMERMLDGQ